MCCTGSPRRSRGAGSEALTTAATSNAVRAATCPAGRTDRNRLTPQSNASMNRAAMTPNVSLVLGVLDTVLWLTGEIGPMCFCSCSPLFVASPMGFSDGWSIAGLLSSKSSVSAKEDTAVLCIRLNAERHHYAR